MNRKEEWMRRKAEIGDRIVYKDFDVTKADITNDEEHIIRVKFASFGNKDSADDILVKGCFAKSINERGPQSATNRKIGFWWMHDSKDPIGKILNIWEEEDGAYADVQLSDFDAVPNAKRSWAQLKDGSINQFSFGFCYVWDKCEYDDAQNALIVREVKLFEISIVSLGCNEQTEFVGVVTVAPKAEDNEKMQKKETKEILTIAAEVLGLAEPTPSLTKEDNELLEFVEKTLSNQKVS